MNEEMGNYIRSKILGSLLKTYEHCQIHIRYIDDYNILQIMLCRKITECTTWTYSRIYVDPLEEMRKDSDYVDDVFFDFVMHADHWIMNKFKRRNS